MSSRVALLVAASSLLRPALTMLDHLPSGHPLVAEGSAQPGVSLQSLGLGMPGSPEFEAQYRKLLGVEEAPPPPPPPLAVEDADDAGAAAFLEQIPSLEAQSRNLLEDAANGADGGGGGDGGGGDGGGDGGDAAVPALPVYEHVQCRCAPLECNCTKTCNCYQKPTGEKEKQSEVPSNAEEILKQSEEGTMGTPAAQNAAARAARRKASARTNWQHFFDPGFLQRGESTSDPTTREFSVDRSRSHSEAEQRVARAADERSLSLLQLNMSAGVRGDFVRQEDLLIYGGDPEFVRRQYGSYQCDETGCDEMKCKCKKYCRCRGVPIAMFEGEDDANSRGPPKADGGAPGFEPWHPDIETEYTFNTEPPREGD